MRSEKIALASLLGGVAIAVAGLAHAGAGTAGFEVTYETEAPNAENATLGTGSTFSVYGVENFDSLPTGYSSGFTTNYNLPSNALYTITGTYAPLSTDGLQINQADQYGGAGGTGNYIVTFDNPGYSLSLTTSNPNGIDYFGYWLSALDAGNQVSFYNSTGELEFTFDPADVIAAIGNNSAYFGNPNYGTSFYGNNSQQPYVFLNFYATGGVSFSKVVFSEDPSGGGYESDNHTVGDWLTMSGTQVPLNNSSFGPGIPEPAAWALMLIGLGSVGASLRSRRRSSLAAA